MSERAPQATTLLLPRGQWVHYVDAKSKEEAAKTLLATKAKLAIEAARLIEGYMGLSVRSTEENPEGLNNSRYRAIRRVVDIYNEGEITPDQVRDGDVVPAGKFHLEEERIYGTLLEKERAFGDIARGPSAEHLVDGAITIRHSAWEESSAQQPVINTMNVLDPSVNRLYVDSFCKSLDQIAFALRYPLPWYNPAIAPFLEKLHAGG